MIKLFFSKTINYTIYYFRRIFLFQTKKEAMREHYDGHILAQNDLIKKNKLTNIILANQNANKYTETFVQKHLKELPFYIHFLYGELPTFHVKKGNIVFKNNKAKFYTQYINTYFKNYYENRIVKKLTNFIKKEKVKLILCEFGPTGLFFTPIASSNKIPLVCIFHGHDAWNKKILAEYNYSTLFLEATVIIGVSKEICLQLENLGCAKEKISYLPCGYNQQLFTYSNHSKNPNIFLTIGRFTETKSPHLTILAFNEVLKVIPDAELRMVGKDGGGELFEACHILVKALKIENSVHFLGIQTPEQVAQEMQNARVFAQHSLTTPLMGDKEGTPVAIMEAMASGLPIVATKHAGIQEIIENGVSGILVEEYDYMTMANEMIRVCNSNKLVEQLGKSATNTIQNNLLIQDNSRILEDIIEKHRLK
jgi:colanic acid/amylovoran biosynthesis glycosyltransferase